MLSTLTAYTTFQRQLQAQPVQTQTAATPEVEAEAKYWRENIKKVTSAEAFTRDDRLYRFAAKAFGYGDDPPPSSVAFIAFSQGAADSGAFANVTSDYRLEEMTRHFAFLEFGLSRTRDSNFIANIERRHRAAVAQESGVSSVDRPNEDAKSDYFRTRIGRVDSADDVVNDPTLFAYTLKAFQLQEYAGNKQLIEAALRQGVDDDSDVANVLNDDRLRALTQTFGFAREAGPNVAAEFFAEGVVRRYKRAEGVVATTAQQGESIEAAYFRERIASIESVDEFMADTRLYTFVMTAFDLGAEVDKRAIVRRVLEEGVSEREDFANQFSDPRYRAIGQALAFDEFGVRNIRDAAVIDQLVEKYERVQLEQSAGAENQAVELAAYFERKGGTLTSWFTVLADSRLRSVAFTALNVPTALQARGIDVIVDELQSRYDIADFADPEKLAAFIERYTILVDTQTTTAANFSPASAALTLLTQSANGAGLYNIVSQL